jgi:hypothetical protein
LEFFNRLSLFTGSILQIPFPIPEAVIGRFAHRPDESLPKNWDFFEKYIWDTTLYPVEERKGCKKEQDVSKASRFNRAPTPIARNGVAPKP